MKTFCTLLLCTYCIFSSDLLVADADEEDKIKATVTWTGLGDGASWTDAMNWDSDPALPGAGDDVVIDLAGSNTINTGAGTKTINSFSLEGSNTLNQSVTINISAASSIGTDAIWNWTGGNLGGAQISNSGIVNIVAAGTKHLSSLTTFINNGSIVLTGVGILYMRGTTVLTNNGLIDIQDPGHALEFWSGTPSLVNSSTGIIRRSTTTGDQTIDVAVTNNGGKIEVLTGGILLTRAGTFNGGTYDTAASTNLEFKTGIHVFAGDLSGNDLGRIFSSFTMSIPVAASFNFSNMGFEKTSGSITGGGTLTNDGLLKITTASTKKLHSATLVNNDRIEVYDDGIFYFQTDAELINNSLFELKNAAAPIDLFSGTTVFTNKTSGIIRKSTDGDVSTFDVPVDNQGGKIDVTSGGIKFTRASTFTGGTYDTAASTSIELATGIHVFAGTLSGSDLGRLFSTSVISIPAAATLNFLGTGFEKAGSDISGGGTLTNTGLLTFRSGATKTLTGNTTIVNDGTIEVYDDPILYFVGTSSMVNNGLFEIKNGNALVDVFSGTPVFLNNASGTIRKSTDAVTAVWDLVLDNQGGKIDVVSGGIRFTRASTFAGGTYDTVAGTSLEFATGIHQFSGELSGSDLGRTFSSSAMSIPASADLNFNNMGFEKSNSNISGDGILKNLGKMSVTGATTKHLTGATTLENDGIFSFEATGIFYLRDTAKFQNDGLLEIVGNGPIDLFSGTPSFENSLGATFRKSSAGTQIVDVDFSNAGLIDVVTGTSNFTADLNHQAGGLISGNGAIDVTTTFTQDGDTGPGASPGVLNWTGDWMPSAGSTYFVELGGATPGPTSSDHDQLVVSGSGTMSGIIDARLFDNFIPTVGDQFTIMTCAGGCSGSFATIASLGGISYSVTVNANDVVLEVTGLSTLSLTAFLAGATANVLQGGAVMDIDLNTGGFLPLTDPYGGGVSVPDFTGARSDVVDWVQVELRNDPGTPQTIPEGFKIGLLKSNGKIVDIDGLSPLFFGEIGGNMHPVIHHRNHLSIASKDPIDVGPSASAVNYSFLSASDQAFGTNPMVLIDGIWSMWGGDDNGDGSITANDFLLGWLPLNGLSPAYNDADFNMDSEFTAFDFLNIWLPGNGQASQIP